MFNIVPTFFGAPVTTCSPCTPTEEGSFDVNLNMYFGDQAKTSFQGGMEDNFQFHSQTSDHLPEPVRADGSHHGSALPRPVSPGRSRSMAISCRSISAAWWIYSWACARKSDAPLLVPARQAMEGRSARGGGAPHSDSQHPHE